MASTIKSDQITNLESVPQVKISAPEGGAKVRYKYTTATTLATGGADGDIFRMCSLPVGAILLPTKCILRTEAMGASVQADIGFASMPGYFIANVDVAAAGDHTFPSAVLTPLTAVAEVQIKLHGAAPAAGKKMTLELCYVLPTG